MDIATRLDLFFDVVKQGSYTKAANLRNIDRSSLSKQIKMLEDELGARLLNRSTRSLSLTEAGKEVLKQAELVRQTIADTHRIVESFHSQPKGLLRITSPTLFGKQYVQKAIIKFMKAYPDVHVQLILDNKKRSIIEDKYDIAFRIGQVQDSNLIARKLSENKPILLASKGFLKEYGTPKTPQELFALPAVVYANDGLVVNRITIGADSKLTPGVIWELQGKYRVNEPELILDAIKSGIGYGMLGAYMLDKNIKEYGLVPLLTNYTLPETLGDIHALYPHRNPTPLVNKFIDTIKEVIGETPIWESYIDNFSDYYKKN